MMSLEFGLGARLGVKAGATAARTTVLVHRTPTRCNSERICDNVSSLWFGLFLAHIENLIIYVILVNNQRLTAP